MRDDNTTINNLIKKHSDLIIINFLGTEIYKISVRTQMRMKKIITLMAEA